MYDFREALPALYQALPHEAKSAADRATKAGVSIYELIDTTPSNDIMSWVGRLPKTPLTAAGARIDPPVSDPMFMSIQS